MVKDCLQNPFGWQDSQLDFGRLLARRTLLTDNVNVEVWFVLLRSLFITPTCETLR